jgi:hypothetical protein
MPIPIVLIIVFVGFSIVLIGAAFGVYAFFYGVKLEEYLRENKRKRWEEIYNPGLVKRFRDPLRPTKYVFDNKDIYDKTILRYKKTLRKSMKYEFVFAAVGFLIAFIATLSAIIITI